MMNGTHAVTGAVAAVGALPLLNVAIPPLAPHGVAVVTWTVLWAGAATLPDMDHPSSSPARFVPGAKLGRHLTLVPSASRVLAGALQSASGGHRHAMHYLTSGAIAGGLAGVLAVLADVAPASWGWALLAVPMAYVAALGLWVCHFGNRTESWLAAAALTALALWRHSDHLWWAGVAIGGGYMVHILGDRFFGGCYSRKGNFVQYAELDTGGRFELKVVRPLSWTMLVVFSVLGAIGWSDSLHGIQQAIAAVLSDHSA